MIGQLEGCYLRGGTRDRSFTVSAVSDGTGVITDDPVNVLKQRF